MLAASDIVDDLDVIDSDTVLDADDLKKPDPASLRSMGNGFLHLSLEKCIVVTSICLYASVCVSVCLFVPLHMPALLHVTFGNGRD